ncbi:MAG: M61 family metallopeptidase [Acidobacteria bacterium]|nr:M61 family metallopeptidase [Acidobacteriota bacterium]
MKTLIALLAGTLALASLATPVLPLRAQAPPAAPPVQTPSAAGAPAPAPPAPTGPIVYRLSFPEPQHRWMQVEATFSGLTQPTLELRMSRSSPGRYSLHEFAKNVYDVHAFGAAGAEIPTTRPDPSGWNVSGFGASVTVKYKVYGDRIDGTYLSIDDTHAHINMPAAIMWARGLELQPVRIILTQPPNAYWGVASQLRPGGRQAELAAPNLQYLMDSPLEFGGGSLKEFEVGDRHFRLAVHHLGTEAELDAFAEDVRTIVEQEGFIYGEYPEYEPGYYIFLADYLPWANGDGMEHRNSTVITASGSLAHDRLRLLDTVAHEFFHGWNVERIRPAGLEPFDFDRANMSDLLWLAEGFTQYYGPLVLRRAQIVDLPRTLNTFTGLIGSVALSPAHLERSAVEMSRMAPFTDGGRPIDRTNWPRTFISYYPFGGAIALALDLTLRDRSDSSVSLDDFMQAMWRKYGKPGGARPGYVDHPYTLADAEATLAEVSGDRAFARDFFARYIAGHEVADYARLLGRAGLVLRKRNPGRAWLGDLRFDASGGALTVATLVGQDWPVYAAGLEQDDRLRGLDGQAVASAADVDAVLAKHKPGERIAIAFADRSGHAKEGQVLLVEDPAIEAVPAELSGTPLTPAQRAFRDRWLGPK